MCIIYCGVAAMSSLVWGTGIAEARAEDRYHVTVLAYQAEPNRPKFAHTFAVFTRAVINKGNLRNATLENHTISWLPASLNVKVLRRRPELGVNLDLPATLQLAQSMGVRVDVWGPFPIRKQLYDLAMQRIAELQAGRLMYIALDGRLRDRGAVNCIHAVSDLDPKRPDLETGIARGDAASAMVVQHLQPWFLPSREDTSWLRNRLGLQPNMPRK